MKRKKRYSDGVSTVSYCGAKANSSHFTHAMDIVIQNKIVTLAPCMKKLRLSTLQKPLYLSALIPEREALDPLTKLFNF